MHVGHAGSHKGHRIRKPILHHPQTCLEALGHVDRGTFWIAVDVWVHAVPAPEVAPFLYAVVTEPYVLQLSLVDFVLLKCAPCDIPSRNPC